MLFLLFASYLLRNGIQAMPLPNSGNITDEPILPAADSTDPTSLRTISDIIWSCLATIFACSWISVHQNIPAPEDSWWMITWRRIRVMFWAIIAPELVISWAIRQWRGARYIAGKEIYAGEPFAWTRTHGYFVEMGGFMLYEDDKPCYTLSFAKLEILEQDKQIEWPKITEKEIEDKSKGDMLAKGLVVLQTGWFVLQCISRGMQGIAITEFEIVTLALSILNGIMYFFWWKKPLDVRCPIPVRPKNTGAMDAGENTSEATPESTPAERVPKQRSLASKIIHTLIKAIFIRPLWEPVSGMMSADVIPSKAKRVPTFYSTPAEELEDSDKLTHADYVFLGIGMIFGAMHCIAWSFHFPSHVEQLLWRTSSLVVTGVPCGLALLGFMIDHFQDLKLVSSIIHECLIFFFIVGGLSYILARIALLVQAFMELRVLPPGAYEAVRWTNFIPHL